jgi:hypothetical protein
MIKSSGQVDPKLSDGIFCNSSIRIREIQNRAVANSGEITLRLGQAEGVRVDDSASQTLPIFPVGRRRELDDRPSLKLVPDAPPSGSRNMMSLIDEQVGALGDEGILHLRN